ncbi:MAG: hypothetical protein RL268_31 [Pseudomonadota bacterium]|jgi:hypothetical protein
MALTSQDIDNLDAAIATGELEVEVNGRRVKYRSISELKAAREHVSSVLQRDASAPRRAVFRVGFSTSRD